MRKKRKTSEVFLTFCLIIVSGFFLKGIIIEAKNLIEAKKVYQKLSAEIEGLKEKKDYLEKEISLLKNENYLKQKLKERFNLVDQGEKVISLVPQKNAEKENKSKSLWQKIKEFFKIKTKEK